MNQAQFGQMQAASLVGQQIAASNTYGPIAPSQTPTLMDALEASLKSLVENHAATLSRQYQVMARLDGPIPTSAQATTDKPSVPGALGRVSMLIDLLIKQTADYDEVTKRLERLA